MSEGWVERRSMTGGCAPRGAGGPSEAFEAGLGGPDRHSGFGSQPDARLEGRRFESRRNTQPGGFAEPPPPPPGAAGTIDVPQPGGGDDADNPLKKTIMLDPGSLPFALDGPPPLSQPGLAQPPAPRQSMVAQPYTPVPRPSHVHAPPQKKKRNRFVVFALSAITVLVVPGSCLAASAMYLLANR